jgi:electron transfer flavoprotein beta subunit
MVCIKRVIDPNVRIRVKPDGSGIDLEGLKMGINPFDDIALEEALRMRERGDAVEVIAVSLGIDEVQQQLRAALAMGADRAILIRCQPEPPPLAVAQALLSVVKRENPDIVLLGKQAIDNDNGQTGPILAALWGRPQATFASAISIKGDSLEVVREVDLGLETLEIDLPAILTVDLRLNEPRHARLPDIIKAKKKPIEILAFETLGIRIPSQINIVSISSPTARAKGVMVKDAAELVGALRNRGLLA